MLSLGGGSVIVQVLGWTTMVPTKLLESGSVTQAIEETFSGNYPCKMCRLAAIQRQLENDNTDPNRPAKEKERDKSPLCFSLRETTRIYVIKLDSFSHLSDSEVMLSYHSSPETPPPDLV